jgi:hypothetical protein
MSFHPGWLGILSGESTLLKYIKENEIMVTATITTGPPLPRLLVKVRLKRCAWLNMAGTLAIRKK